MTAIAIPARRRGARHWWHGFSTMLRWEITRMRLLLPITILVQAFTGAGLVLGIGIFFEVMDAERILYLSTGSVVITLVAVGMVMGPQLVAEQRQTGQFDYMASLPVPRSAATSAWIGLNVLIAVPGAVIALVAASLRYDAQFSVSPILLPAVALILVGGALIGYAYGTAIPEPRVVALVSQLLVFFIFGFSPIAYPATNLPAPLQTMHHWLPFEAMADLVRAGLTEGMVESVTRPFLVLGAWTLAAGVVTIRTIGRRG